MGIVDLLELLANWGSCPGNAEDWFWETATLDPVNGVFGSVTSFVRDGNESWFSVILDHALVLECLFTSPAAASRPKGPVQAGTPRRGGKSSR